MRIILPALLLAALACPSPAALAEDHGLRTATQMDQRTRRYPNETAAHVVDQAARVFELAQANYRILYGKHGVVAYRHWGTKTILGGSVDLHAGQSAYWYLDARQDGADVIVRVRCIPEADPNTPLDPAEHQNPGTRLVAPATLDPEAPLPGEDSRAQALYATFFNRLDVLLGQNRYWLYCRAAEEYAKMEKLGGGLEAWCAEAGDARPGSLNVP